VCETVEVLGKPTRTPLSCLRVWLMGSGGSVAQSSTPKSKIVPDLVMVKGGEERYAEGNYNVTQETNRRVGSPSKGYSQNQTVQIISRNLSGTLVGGIPSLCARG
jgi:hypothetical protein